MQTVVIYEGAVTTGTTEGDLPAVVDPTLTRQNSHYLLPTPMKLLMAYAGGVGLSRARINAPSLRRVVLPYLWPLNLVEAPITDPNIADYRDCPFTLPASEEIEIDTTTTDAGTQRHCVALWLGDGDTTMPRGTDVFSVRCTGAITAVAATWTLGALTFGQTLPAGNYAVVGMQVVSATCIVARLVIPGYVWRPGVLGSSAINIRPPFHGDKGPLGTLCYFNTLNLPQLEIFCTAADTTQVVHLDLVKVG